MNKKNKTNKTKKEKDIKTLILIDGTILNTSNYDYEKNKIIFKKIKLIIESYNKIATYDQNYDKNYDKKVIYYQKKINELILELN